MKISPILAIVSGVAVLAVAVAGYYFAQYRGVSARYGEAKSQYDNMAGQYDMLLGQADRCQKDKTETEGRLEAAQNQAANAARLGDVLNAALNSFMTPGDYKAQTIGSKEAADIDRKIGDIANSQDRMNAEQQWGDFKSSKLLNPLFGLLRGLSQSISTVLSQPPSPQQGLAPIR